MAITKVTNVQAVRVMPPQDSSAENTTNLYWPTINVEYQIVLDDTADDELPVYNYKNAFYEKFDENGDATVYSSVDSLVKKVLDAVWA